MYKKRQRERVEHSRSSQPKCLCIYTINIRKVNKNKYLFFFFFLPPRRLKLKASGVAEKKKANNKSSNVCIIWRQWRHRPPFADLVAVNKPKERKSEREIKKGNKDLFLSFP